MCARRSAHAKGILVTLSRSVLFSAGQGAWGLPRRTPTVGIKRAVQREQTRNKGAGVGAVRECLERVLLEWVESAVR